MFITPLGHYKVPYKNYELFYYQLSNITQHVVSVGAACLVMHTEDTNIEVPMHMYIVVHTRAP